MAILNGRRVSTRRELADKHDLSVTHLEKLYREREANGHPEPVPDSAGRELTWYDADWRRWYKDLTGTAGLESRAELQERTGLGRSTLELLWREREVNKHPQPEKTVGNTMYWNSKVWDRWYKGYQAGQAWRTEIDRSGNAEDEITLAQAARVLHMEPTSITKYPTRKPAHWPEPVRVETTDSGRLKRYYRRGDIWTYGERRERTGGGRPAGTAGTTRRYPYDGDPRLEKARTALKANPDMPTAQLAGELAREHGGAAGTWSHIVSSARQNPED
ncbi:hypothetical protein [Streptomyces sp. NPDC006971]|uniref:hypothetical protein n=1 Tax=Streptomyces sp. NPDC006971 TaxID=3154784 RepID=UPI0033CA909D